MSINTTIGSLSLFGGGVIIIFDLRRLRRRGTSLFQPTSTSSPKRLAHPTSQLPLVRIEEGISFEMEDFTPSIIDPSTATTTTNVSFAKAEDTSLPGDAPTSPTHPHFERDPTSTYKPSSSSSSLPLYLMHVIILITR